MNRSDGSVDASPKKIHVKASEFLREFRNRSDDYYLMEKFSLKPKYLGKIYDQLLERGLLAEFEYAHRDKKSPEIEMQIGRSNTRHLSVASTVVELQTAETCPNCNRAKHPDYPDSCPFCGVVFAKVRRSQVSSEVSEEAQYGS